jgi:hypothetical protein
MTTVVPYSVISCLISSVTVSPSTIDRILLDETLHRAHLWLAALDLVAILPSALRGESHKVPIQTTVIPATVG